MSVGPVQIILILVVIVLLFGRGKISELMGDVAKGIKSFKKGMADDVEEAKEDVSKTIDNNATMWLRRPSRRPRPSPDSTFGCCLGRFMPAMAVGTKTQCLILAL